MLFTRFAPFLPRPADLPPGAAIALAVALGLAASAAQAQTATPAAADRPSSTVTRGANVTLDFVNAEIDAVARTMATITGRNVVVDPRVKGTMTLTSTAPVNPAQAMRLFAAQLRTQGFALVDNAGMHIVVPEAEAKLQGGAVSAGQAPAAAGGQIQTQIFRLTHENANNLVPILRPLISPNNTINANPGNNSLVITDYGDNLQRLGRIIAALDVSNATGVEIIPLRYAVASDLAPLVARLVESGSGGAPVVAAGVAGQPGVPAGAMGGGADGSYRTTLVPEPRSNSIIVRAANPARVALVKTLVQQLDRPPAQRPDGGSGNIHVVYLKNADAAKLAVTLRAALASLPGANPQAGGAAGGVAPSGASPVQQQPVQQASGSSGGLGTGPSLNLQGANQPSTGGQIQADPATNSLIISAPEPVYRELRAVIDQLDQRRAQVFIESLVAEVNMSKAADFGVQWQMFGKSGNTVGVVGTNYSTGRATGGNATNIFDVAAAALGYARAASSGTTTTTTAGTTTTTTTSNPAITAVSALRPSAGFNLLLGTQALGILANFMQSSGTANVLSTPTLLTLDNEEAKIIVGKNVPFVTGSFANTGASGATVNPFQTYERKDVGLTLRVRPQINENGTVKLVLYQEVSSVDANTATSLSGPTTSKRAIESSVLVDDGSIVVLGGLMEDVYGTSEDKVPLLGDVPIIGNLFKSQNRTLNKTNLMVFLRPVIVRDGASTEGYSLDRYELMRSTQQANQPQPSVALPINQAPVVPPLMPTNPNAWTRPAPPPLVERVVPSAMPAGGEYNYDGR